MIAIMDSKCGGVYTEPIHLENVFFSYRMCSVTIIAIMDSKCGGVYVYMWWCVCRGLYIQTYKHTHVGKPGI